MVPPVAIGSDSRLPDQSPLLNLAWKTELPETIRVDDACSDDSDDCSDISWKVRSRPSSRPSGLSTLK